MRQDRPATVKLDGTVIDPAASYRVTANSFIATGGDGFPVRTEGTERVEKVRGIEAFESCIRAKSPLQAPAPGRVTRVNRRPGAGSGAEPAPEGVSPSPRPGSDRG
ncbi:5'-nucleotidase C-terminal domain-containing protein [Nonomuraea composti]|uniref:5'-nucleotidase C-terminal domain-containing protein n=1 Tax=Nonomuraea composti TaxID=2720023 RepID=UPI001981F6FE|nr:5'-nucleotidase C-terminal domain-containing protein [Nonomuraea sp. FMUSA5-5]